MLKISNDRSGRERICPMIRTTPFIMAWPFQGRPLNPLTGMPLGISTQNEEQTIDAEYKIVDGDEK
jgi:hypothetical protein